MECDVLRAGVEKPRHQRLAQPKRLVTKATFDAAAPVFRLVEEEFP